MKNLLFILFIAVIALGCEESMNDSKKKELLTSEIELLSDVRVKEFKMSSCQGSCLNQKGSVLNQTFNNDTLSLQIGHWMNCAKSVKDDIVGFEYEDGILNILLKRRPIDVVVEENGDTTFTYEWEVMCNCYFVMDFKLTGIKETPDSIRVNGEPVENYLGMLAGVKENIGILSSGKLTVKDGKNNMKKSLAYSANLIRSYNADAFEEEVEWSIIDSSGADTLITFIYSYLSPETLCYNNRCDSLVEIINLGNDVVYKFYGYDEGVHDSEVYRYISIEHGILASFGQAPPEYFSTEKNRELLDKLKKHGI